MSVSQPFEEQFRDGYLYSRKCRDESAEDMKTLSLEFDYEFALPNPGEPFPEVQWQDLPKVEFGMLRRMEQVTGVGSCDFSVQLKDPWLQSAGSGLYRVVGLSSGESDSLHPVGECRYIDRLEDDLLCYAMRGKMDVFYTGPSASVIEDYMMYHLRVELDSQNVSVGSISQTRFVGKSTENPYDLVAEGDDKDREMESPRSSDNSSGILPLVLAIPIALALIIAVGLFVTKRRRKSDSSEISSQQIECVDDPECGVRSGDLPLSSKSQPMVLAETDSSEKSEDEDNGAANLSADSIFDDVEALEEVGSDAPMVMDLKVSTGNETGSALVQNPAVLALAAAATSLTPVGAQNPFDSAASKEDYAHSSEGSLPPLPPGVRPAKIAAATGQSARRRRRKKKRKAAERMSSSAPEMATIQETPENSDDEDDESYGSGSEHSWSGAEDNDSPQRSLPFQGSLPDFAPVGHPDESLSFDETLVTDNRTFIS